MINVEPEAIEKPNLYTFGQRGQISNILPDSSSTNICFEWTQFSLKQLCSFDVQWKEEIIYLYYYLCSYYASESNVEVPFQVDLSPCSLTNSEMIENEPLYIGNCDVVVIFNLDKHNTKHYVLLKIDHVNHLGSLYDSMSDGKGKINKTLQKQIFEYLKKNKFINPECCSSNVKWPGLVSRRQRTFW